MLSYTYLGYIYKTCNNYLIYPPRFRGFIEELIHINILYIYIYIYIFNLKKQN